jgi:hypothetical protein
VKPQAVPITPVPEPPRLGINAARIAEIVDELGVVGRKLAPWRLAIAQETALRTHLRAEFDASPADLAFDAIGDHFTAQLGPKAIQRSINPAKLIKAIGLKLYASIARITLGDLEANVEPGVIAGVVTAANTGARSIKLFERGAKTA